MAGENSEFWHILHSSFSEDERNSLGRSLIEGAAEQDCDPYYLEAVEPNITTILSMLDDSRVGMMELAMEWGEDFVGPTNERLLQEITLELNIGHGEEVAISNVPVLYEYGAAPTGVRVMPEGEVSVRGVFQAMFMGQWLDIPSYDDIDESTDLAQYRRPDGLHVVRDCVRIEYADNSIEEQTGVQSIVLNSRVDGFSKVVRPW